MRLLKVLKAVVESYNDDDAVAYNIAGEPLNRKAYKEDLQAVEQEIKDGNLFLKRIWRMRLKIGKWKGLKSFGQEQNCLLFSVVSYLLSVLFSFKV